MHPKAIYHYGLNLDTLNPLFLDYKVIMIECKFNLQQNYYFLYTLLCLNIHNNAQNTDYLSNPNIPIVFHIQFNPTVSHNNC